MMVILSFLAVGLGRRTSIDLALTKFAVGQSRASNLAWAGLMYAIDQIKKDSEDSAAAGLDTAYLCGITLEEGQVPEDIFKEVRLGDGRFDVSFVTQDPLTGLKKTHYGLRDEEGRININALSRQNYNVLSSLISVLGFEDVLAETIAMAAVDWRDSDAAATNAPSATEESEYSYRCKNFFFESPEELLLLKGMTPEIYSKVKNYVTVFPQDDSRLMINMNTAPEIVIRALARSKAGFQTNTELSDADSMAAKIISYRRGEDGQEYTSDDRKIIANELGLNQKEMAIFLSLSGSVTDVSNYLRVRAVGKDEGLGIDSVLEAVIDRNDLSIVFWQKE
ncbi:MAG TPA: type II secretion system protein GspK [Candidatus Omnitrophota bacterium]|nr:type II secretion system protein GspK [Candidatus Omnitrophota bacterium]HPD84695.1 type II secretion system protein GspK [Candidatus Omnitrophota bacterium]HRZ03553.1 type II secretion system protein GspK [Candidatus Omnitrophota bacterium]